MCLSSCEYEYIYVYVLFNDFKLSITQQGRFMLRKGSKHVKKARLKYAQLKALVR